jgi:predicted nucleic acid-binding protein
VGFLIDTNLWIAIERGKLSAADIHSITGPAPVYLSPVNLAEFRFGIELLTDAKQKRRATATFRRMRRKPMLRITAEAAEVFEFAREEIRSRKYTPPRSTTVREVDYGHPSPRHGIRRCHSRAQRDILCQRCFEVP